jgi:hypothetical protein
MGSDMQRREFVTLLGGAAASWPLASRAQQPVPPVVGFIRDVSATSSARLVDAFRKGLSETGYVEGQNVTVEYYWLEGQYDRLPALVAVDGPSKGTRAKDVSVVCRFITEAIRYLRFRSVGPSKAAELFARVAT